eukprot:g4574.t1
MADTETVENVNGHTTATTNAITQNNGLALQVLATEAAQADQTQAPHSMQLSEAKARFEGLLEELKEKEDQKSADDENRTDDENLYLKWMCDQGTLVNFLHYEKAVETNMRITGHDIMHRGYACATGSSAEAGNFCRKVRQFFTNLMIAGLRDGTFYDADDPQVADHRVGAKIFDSAQEFLSDTFEKELGHRAWPGMPHGERWHCHDVLQGMVAEAAEGTAEDAEVIDFLYSFRWELPAGCREAYARKIEHPMHFTRVMTKLHIGDYKTVGEFILAVELIFDNCIRFWTSWRSKGRNGDIVKQAKKLRGVFYDKYAEKANIGKLPDRERAVSHALWKKALGDKKEKAGAADDAKSVASVAAEALNALPSMEEVAAAAGERAGRAAKDKRDAETELEAAQKKRAEAIAKAEANAEEEMKAAKKKKAEAIAKAEANAEKEMDPAQKKRAEAIAEARAAKESVTKAKEDEATAKREKREADAAMHKANRAAQKAAMKEEEARAARNQAAKAAKARATQHKEKLVAAAKAARKAAKEAEQAAMEAEIRCWNENKDDDDDHDDHDVAPAPAQTALFDAEAVAALGAKVRAVLALGLVPGAAAMARVVRRTDQPAAVALEEVRCRVRRCLRDEAAGGGLQREDLLRGTATVAAAMLLTLWEQQNPWRAKWASSF